MKKALPLSSGNLAKKSTKAHSKRWLKQEYAAALAELLEELLEELPKDKRIIDGVCHVQGREAVSGRREWSL